jgi:site-specific DNA-adenine methylase
MSHAKQTKTQYERDRRHTLAELFYELKDQLLEFGESEEDVKTQSDILYRALNVLRRINTERKEKKRPHSLIIVRLSLFHFIYYYNYDFFFW